MRWWTDTLTAVAIYLTLLGAVLGVIGLFTGRRAAALGAVEERRKEQRLASAEASVASVQADREELNRQLQDTRSDLSSTRTELQTEQQKVAALALLASQQAGDAAVKVSALLPRTLTSAQRSQIVAELQAVPPRDRCLLMIMAVTLDHERFELAQALGETATSAGWQVSVSQAVMEEVPSGISVVFKTSDTSKAAVDGLTNAFRGIAARTDWSHSNSKGTVRVFVGR